MKVGEVQVDATEQRTSLTTLNTRLICSAKPSDLANKTLKIKINKDYLTFILGK